MYRATTPKHIFTLPIPTSNCKDILITYAQKGKIIIEKHKDDGVLPSGMTLDGDDVIIVLTQEETNKFKENKATAQIRVLTNGGKVCASKRFQISVKGVDDDQILD